MNLKSYLIQWYMNTHLRSRRILLALLTPALEYLFLEPARIILIKASIFSAFTGILILPILLLFGIMTATVICLFVYEFLVGIGKKINNKVAGFALALGVVAWVLGPIYIINLFGAKQ